MKPTAEEAVSTLGTNKYDKLATPKEETVGLDLAIGNPCIKNASRLEENRDWRRQEKQGWYQMKN